ncbi:MAG: hypothetical protein RL213_1201 [Bacteroidota bacterium]|jgi:uncharacterized integral membrane protein (TIGR00698 family)
MSVRHLPFFLLLIIIPVLGLSPATSLVLGIAVGVFFVQPFPSGVKTVSKYLLQASIVGLGFGMDLGKVAAAGGDGFFYTLLSLAAALAVGFMLGRWLKLDPSISYLISVGTAICGGSAIAAVSSVMKTDEKNVSVSIGIVFILNAVALLVFPVIGHYFAMDEHTFGIWSAIAIHDTSSVVGATAHYGTGDTALMTATTIKLARALWIIPITLFTAWFFRSEKSASVFPWFILFFLVASAIYTYLPFPAPLAQWVVRAAKTGFSITLFLIGSGITRAALRSVGFRPMLHGVLLWLLILSASLFLLLSA